MAIGMLLTGWAQQMEARFDIVYETMYTLVRPDNCCTTLWHRGTADAWCICLLCPVRQVWLLCELYIHAAWWAFAGLLKKHLCPCLQSLPLARVMGILLPSTTFGNSPFWAVLFGCFLPLAPCLMLVHKVLRLCQESLALGKKVPFNTSAILHRHC